MKSKKLKSAFLFILLIPIVNCAQTDWRLGGNSTTADSRVGTNSDFDLIFETNNVERLRITKIGLLGIGTTNPLSAFHLVGNAKLEGGLQFPLWVDSIYNSKRFLYIDSGGNTCHLRFSQLVDGIYSTAEDCVSKSDGGGYPAPVWKNSGGSNYGVLYTGTYCPARVGIGTALPDNTLEVRGDLKVVNGNGGNFRIGEEAQFVLNYSGSLNPFCVNSSGGYFKIANDCSVNIHRTGSIGDGAPVFRIFNYGDGIAHSLFEINSSGSSDQIYLLQNSTMGDGSTITKILINNGIDQPSSVYRIFNNGGIEQVYFNVPGGNTNVPFRILSGSLQFGVEPTELMAVNSDGRLYAQAVTVKNAPFWPDYVFTNAYERMTISDLDRFIQTNGHLPNVPTQVEISNNGLDLYESNRILLEKVEELTLYIIELEKRISKIE